MSKVYALFLVITLTGCASNVYYFNEAQKQENLENGSVSIFIDAFGSVYPKNGLPPELTTNIPRESGIYDLMSMCDFDCSAVVENTEAFEICQMQHLPEKERYQFMRSVQLKLWNSRAKYLYEQIKGTKKEVVFLLHGYNSSYKDSTDSFKLMKEEVRQHAMPRERQFLFVNLYWDGFEGNPFSGAWSRAQASGPLVGFRLRQFFNAFSDMYKAEGKAPPNVTFLTHSSGAFVVGSLIGNPFFALPLLQNPKESDSEYNAFKKHRHGYESSGEYRIPEFSSMRIGMIAAATPTTTFNVLENKKDNSCKKEVDSGVLAKNVTLIFSMNGRDFALTKMFNLQNLSGLGATGSGSDKDRYCTYLNVMNESRDNVSKVHAIHFENTYAPWYRLTDKHSLGNSGYFDRTEQTNTFFNALLNNDYSDPNKHYVSCP
ncbi:hypothetical protein [Pseudoalteromonas rubra]|uniref:hypothetical protein n=1 Tax=Pseudoalteromonas rubra TaxID=43658 RepID=UPI000F76E029|nr:hypothetical protein [Pseudoalteromonas rubra]